MLVCVFVCSLFPPRSFDGSSPNLVGVCRWTSHLPLRGSFSKRSTGRRVNGSNGSTGHRVTFTILYMIADDARVTPPRCKKHTAYDDTRLMPHHCKNHTASFARLTGKFPSIYNTCSRTCNFQGKRIKTYLFYRPYRCMHQKVHFMVKSLHYCLKVRSHLKSWAETFENICL